MKGIFVTGTDTGVGKTLVTAGLVAALRKRGINAGIMKPVHTGCKTINGRLIPEDSLLLSKAAAVDDPIELITPYMFREPVAPYTAAKKTNTVIDMGRIIKSFNTLCKRHDFMVVEGIGGIMVPLTKDVYVADLIKKLCLPAIIVTRPDLGTINHTMLTINCMKDKKIPITGIVINYSRKIRATLAEKSCPETLERLSGIPVIGVIPYISVDEPARKYSFQGRAFQRLIDLLSGPLR